jgi:predicted O-methyltransferase YrrM
MMNIPGGEMNSRRINTRFVAVLLAAIGIMSICYPQALEQSLDAKVRAFLDKMEYRWRDMNVPEGDGKILYDLVIDNKYKKALEIGTSTGRSGIWIAWALSKTGGRLITIEIDEDRYREAVANFREAGLAAFIDARLADAHELVKELPGPFDFVFIDADKEWYTNYAEDVVPKLLTGGCIAAHNVYAPRSGWGGRYGRGGTGEYYNYMKNLPGFETDILSESRSGLAVSFKKASKQ